METETDKDIQQAATSQKRGDPAPLVTFMRESIERRIEEVNIAADSEIRAIDSEVQGEIDEFREMQRARHEETVKNEGIKIRNLSATGIKKQKLEGAEAFINKVTAAAAAAVRVDPRYAEFLANCVRTGLENVKGGSATILLSADDMQHSEMINRMVTDAAYKFKVKFAADDRVKTGGAMVVDDEAEVIYNNTVERILYRKRDEIRREIVKGMKEAGAAGEN